MVKPDGKKRISKIDTYLNVAETFAYRSTCLKRKYSANPCPVCARLIIQSGIRNVYMRVGENADEYDVIPSAELKWHL